MHHTGCTENGHGWKWGVAALGFAIVGAASGYFIYASKKDAPEPTPAVTAAPEEAGDRETFDEKESATPVPTEAPKRADEWTDDVSYSAELVLSQIAEDMAKQAAQNPDTVKMKASTMVFGNKGDIYTVESDFECSSLVNYTETHTIRVYCEADTDRGKIQPYEVYLDGVLVASLDS